MVIYSIIVYCFLATLLDCKLIKLLQKTMGNKEIFLNLLFQLLKKMKISGFSFVKNAIKFGYPLRESIESLLPLVDEYIIACGDSDDGTTELVRSIDSPKIRIIETVWDAQAKSGGRIYAEQTNLALKECSGDWCFYLQADEVLHEQDYDLIKSDLATANANDKIEAMLFRYIHFYGKYDLIGTGRQWYRREIRAFRNIQGVTSWGDAQGFRVANPDASFRKLKAMQSEANIYHYGWVRPPKNQFMKIRTTMKFYGGEDFNPELADAEDFIYDGAYSLTNFKGSHPKLMESKIATDRAWTDLIKIVPKVMPMKVKILDAIENATGVRIGEYKNFIEVKI